MILLDEDKRNSSVVICDKRNTSEVICDTDISVTVNGETIEVIMMTSILPLVGILCSVATLLSYWSVTTSKWKVHDGKIEINSLVVK